MERLSPGSRRERLAGTERMAEAFQIQARICAHGEAPFYAELVRRCGDDIASDGPVGRLVQGWRGDPVTGWLPLRVLGAVHARVLDGDAPELERFYPTTGGAPAWPEAWDDFRAYVERGRERLVPALARFPQTNEVGRSGTLLGGFLSVARRFGLPLRILELGASAGLNLLFDGYRFALGPHRFGPEGSAVEIESEWRGLAPPLDAPLAVASRRGCDVDPIDVTDREERLRLMGFVWPDHVGRLRRLRSAIEHAIPSPPSLDRAPAADWLDRELAAPREGVTTVVYHSSFWAYVGEAERARIRERIEAAGERAEPSAPIAWLRLEEAPAGVELRLRAWPGGSDTRLAQAQVHGRWVRWLA